jgi:hypothetical protein
LRHCSTSLTLRESSTSITIPSSDGWGVIRYIGRACAINGVSLLTWYAPMMLTPWRPHSFRMVVAFRWSWSLSCSLAGGPYTHVFGADSMKLPKKIERGAAGSFLK